MRTKSKTTPIFKSLNTDTTVNQAISNALEPIESRLFLSASLFSAHALIAERTIAAPIASQPSLQVAEPLALSAFGAVTSRPFVSVETPAVVPAIGSAAPVAPVAVVDLLGSNGVTSGATSGTSGYVRPVVSIEGTFADDLFVDGVCILPVKSGVVITVQSLGHGGTRDGDFHTEVTWVEGDGVIEHGEPIIITLPVEGGGGIGDGEADPTPVDSDPSTSPGTQTPGGAVSDPTNSGGGAENPTTGTGSSNGSTSGNGSSSGNGSAAPVGSNNGNTNGNTSGGNSNTGSNTGSGSTGNGTPSTGNTGSTPSHSGQSDEPVIRPQSPGSGSNGGTGHTNTPSTPVVVVTPPPASEAPSGADNGSHPSTNLPSRPRGNPAAVPLTPSTNSPSQAARQSNDSDASQGSGIESSTTTMIVATSASGTLVGAVSTPSNVWADTGAVIEGATLAPIGQAVSAAVQADVSSMPLGIVQVAANKLVVLKDKVVDIGTSTRLFQIARLGLPASLLGDSIGAFIGESASQVDQPQAAAHRQRARWVTAAVVAADVILFASYYRNVTAKRAREKEKQRLVLAKLVPVPTR